MKAQTKFAENSELFGSTEARKKGLAEIDAVLADYDLKARTVEEFTFETREEAAQARQELSNVKELLAGLDYEHSEADAIKALHNLENYNAQSVILPKYLEKMHELLNAFDKKARTVICGGEEGKKVVFEDREEASRIKAMLEIQDLEKSYQSYIKEETAAINHISELLRKNLPPKITAAYFELISDFEDKQRKISSDGEEAFSLKFILKSFMFLAVDVAILVLCAYMWDGLSWPITKSIAVASMIIVPLIFYGVSTNNVSSEDAENSEDAETSDVIKISTFFLVTYWFSALLTFFLPDWNNFSWFGWKGVISVFTLILISCAFDIFADYSKSKISRIYVEGLNELTLKVDGYKKFREEHKNSQKKKH